MSGSPPSRRSDLDLARALVVGGLFFFHSARVFDVMSPFYIRNDPPSLPLTLLVGWALLWGMPLLFWAAGASAWHSLQTRAPRVFLLERIRRLLVPLLTGLLLLVPPQVYLGLRQAGSLESYWQFLPRFFDVRLAARFPFFIVPSPQSGLFEPAHLWFLWALFAYSLVLLLVRGTGVLACPFLGRQDGGRQGRLPYILLLGLPLGLIEAALGTAEAGGWNLNVYLLLLLYGYWMADKPYHRKAMAHAAPLALILGLISYAALAVWGFGLSAGGGGAPLVGYGWTSVGWRMLKGLSGWCWLAALIGLGSRRLAPAEVAAPSNEGFARWLRYASEAALPVYVLHQTVIVALAYYVVRWPVGVMVKYLAISLGSLGITLATYTWLIRRVALLRFLFGLRPNKPRR